MLSEQQASDFRTEGYLLVRKLIDPADFADLRTEYSGVLDRLCKSMHAEGKITSDFAELDFTERFLALCRETRTVYAQNFNFVLPQVGVTEQTPIWLGRAVFDMLRHPQVLDVVEDLIGGEIEASPVGNVRIKPPEHLIGDTGGERRRGLFGTTPWHQDNGVVTEEADNTDMITVWFPLTSATAENGCLQLLPRTHGRGVVVHCPVRGDLAIPEKQMPADEPMPVPMEPGDVLFLHRHLLHAALPNVSDEVRWSFDLRYIPTGAPTGRSAFPSFVVRSRNNPQSELRDIGKWRDMWQQSRDFLVSGKGPVKWNRWRSDAAMCA